MGVFLAYIGSRGHALLDRELYLTEDWTRDPDRLRAVGLAPDTPFATKPQLARRMLERTLDAGVPMAWVVGDTVYGHSRALRSWLEERGLHHVLAVPRDEELWAGSDLWRVDEARLVLGQCRVADKSNEITAMPALLEMLVLEGGIVTIDAMGCYTRIAQTIRWGADYVLALKENQPQWHAAVVETFAPEQAEAFEGCDHDFHKTVNKNHGRIETRRCWVIGTPEYIRYVDPDGLWPDLRSLVLIEAQRRQGDRVTSETRYYIPACRRRRSSCCRACAATGASRMPCTGFWTWPSGRTKAASVPATPPTTCRSCADWPSTCCAVRPRSRAASPPSASRPAGTTATCSRSCQIRMRLPCMCWV